MEESYQEPKEPEGRVEEEGGAYAGQGGVGMPPAEIGEAMADFLKWVLDSTTKLDLIKRNLKGETPTYKKVGDHYDVEWKAVVGRKMLNDEGVNKVIFLIEGFFSKEIATANISYEESHKLTESTMKELKNTIAINAKKWELDETLYVDLVLYLDSEIFLALTRVKEGGISKLVKPTYKRIETFSNDRKKPKGLFGGFLGGK